MTNDACKVVANGYDEIADNYLQWTASSPVRLHWLGQLIAMLPESARIVDLGCGAAAPVAQALSNLGHHITGIDGSVRQIELARVNAPLGTFIVSDMTTVDFDPASLDAVTAFYSITHVPREAHFDLLARVHRWLKPGGIFLGSLGHDDTPSWTGEWLGTPMHFSHFDAATNRRLVEQAGFSIETAEVVGEHEHGRLNRFLWVIGRKSDK